jgi:hypothetical protein
MVKRSIFFLAIAAALILIGFYLFGSKMDKDERAIRDALENLAELARVDGRENMIAAGARAHSIAECFVGDATVTTQSYGVSIGDKNEIKSMTFYLRSHADRFAVDLGDVEVELSKDRTAAVSYADAHLQLHMDGGRESAFKEIEFTWRNTEEGWKLSQVKMLDIVERPL